MSLPAPREGKCPNCGATVEFKLGSSRATVCGYCQAVVARAGQNYETIGKAADLIPTGAKIAIGTRGAVNKISFEVVGRLQYEWKSGVWDEWYIGFSDGRWGWLAEAQGRYYVTFKVPPRPLPRKGVTPGASLFIEGLGRFVVSDVKQAKIVGVQGELPEPVTLGETPLSADMETEKGAFATLDFGMAGSEPALYLGQQVPFEALHLGGLPAGTGLRTKKPSGEKLKCPNCGAPVSLRIPDQSVRVVCASCQHLLATSEGAFRVIEAIAKGKHEPRIALGSKGNLRGTEWLVVGWMIRSCMVEGTRYPWDEYLLWSEATQTFAWLVETDGHWQLAKPLSVAEVHLGGDALYAGKRFRHFSSVKGVVERVLGEFYWEVQTGDATQLDDFIAPPEGLSRELADGEVNWSHLEHVERAELAKAFNKPGLANMQQSGVGEIQPWPLEATWKGLGHWMLGGIAALFLMLVVFALRPEPVYLDQTFDSIALQHTEAGAKQHSFLSPPFEVSPHQALRVEFSSDVNQSWAYAGGAVINDASGRAVSFGIESSYYSGVDSDGSWSEGSRGNTEVLRAPGSGKTLVRADLQWDPKASGPPNMRLRVVGDAYSGWQFFIVLALLCWPLLFLMHRASFEKARWYNSNLYSSDED